MDSPRQDDTQLSSPESINTSSTLLSIPASNFLTVPTAFPASRFFSSLEPTAFAEDYDLEPLTPASELVPEIPQFLRNDISPVQPSPPNTYIRRRSKSPAQRKFLSVYSASSIDTDNSKYSNPPAKPYRVPSFQNMSSRRISPVCQHSMTYECQLKHPRLRRTK
jgi:hypothetical protein